MRNIPKTRWPVAHNTGPGRDLLRAPAVRRGGQRFCRGLQELSKGTKAADGLLKLGMSLARANQKQNACVAFAQLDHDFPARRARSRAFFGREEAAPVADTRIGSQASVPWRVHRFARLDRTVESSPFLVAVSGGPTAWRSPSWRTVERARGGQICALTVDHRLRPESSDEIRRLGAWLSARAIRHEVLVWTEEKPRTGIQEAARFARYRLLGGWCRDHACLHLLTGHHRDDQIETHLIRRRAHSGPDGLAGMSAIRELADCRLLRPLLGVARDRLVAFLEAERQPFISDPSNLDPAFERSRLRQGDGQRRQQLRLLGEILVLGRTRAARGRDTHLARFVGIPPASLLDPAMMPNTPPEMAEQLLSPSPLRSARFLSARRARIARCWQAWPSGADTRVVPFHPMARAYPGDARTRQSRAAVLLRPGERIVWDQRFEIMMPRADGGPAINLGLPESPHLDRRTHG